MPTDFARTLVVGVSSTALFDLTEVDKKFREAERANKEEAIQRYRDEMRAAEAEPLRPGAAMPVVKALLGLNKLGPPTEEPLVEVVIMSRNSPETGVRILNAIRREGLPISRSAFTGGEPVAPLLRAYSVDLFLTTSPRDAQAAIDERSCAAAIIGGAAPVPYEDDGRVRIAFDGDAVLFDGSSELLYQKRGIEAFQEYESAHQEEPLGEGPLANFLRKLVKLQERLPTRIEYSPVRVSLVTARNGPSDLRVIKTFRSWGVYVDEAYFLGGLKKGPVLAALRPHIYFDDQDIHLKEAALVVPSGKVPYASESPLASAIEATVSVAVDVAVEATVAAGLVSEAPIAIQANTASEAAVQLETVIQPEAAAEAEPSVDVPAAAAASPLAAGAEPVRVRRRTGSSRASAGRAASTAHAAGAAAKRRARKRRREA